MWTGAQDFLPDYEQVPQWHSVYSVYPKYSPLFTAMRKAKEWLHTARVRDRIVSHSDCHQPCPCHYLRRQGGCYVIVLSVIL